MVERVNGKNPLVMQAMDIDLPMPGEEADDEGYYDDEGYWHDPVWEDGHEGPEEEEEWREPMSEDERLEGVNRHPPASGYESDFQYPAEDREPRARAPRQPSQRRPRRRLPPMPRVPRPQEAPVWNPPFEVDEAGNAIGVPLSRDGDPPIEEMPVAILEDGRREPFNPEKGSMQGVTSMVYGQVQRK